MPTKKQTTTKQQISRTSSRPKTRSAGNAAAKSARTATKASRKATRGVKRATERASATRTATTARKTSANTARKTSKAVRKVSKTGARGSAKAGTQKRVRSRRAASDAIAFLKQDHRTVEGLFVRFEKAGTAAHRRKRQLVDTMIEELSRHAAIEELVFYPAVRREVDGAKADVLEALEEHHVAKLLLHELEDLAASDERFDAKVTVMIENVRHHVKEEEHELFPEVRDQMSRRRLVELGDELRAAKPRVPTRPHPAAPDEPPANTLMGGAVAALDKARAVGKRTVERVRDDALA